jgi:hypothetical protein
MPKQYTYILAVKYVPKEKKNKVVDDLPTYLGIEWTKSKSFFL